MKTKLFRDIGYFVFILLALSSCVNEMDMVEDEQGLEVLSSRTSPPFAGYENWVKNLIDYKNSEESKSYLSKVENLLQTIYRAIPEMRDVIDNLVNWGYKFRVAVKYNGEKKSWFNPNSSEIGFSGDVNIRIENMIHELLHFFAFYTVDEYRKRLYAAREEYEIRVLTDLFMRRDFSTFPYEYQGLNSEHTDYESYLIWLQKILNNEVQNMDQFATDFFNYGFSYIVQIEDDYIKVKDLHGYRPRLLAMVWFYGKI
ncbi:hypothetical protein [Butyricimonas paravirosa]|uniref:hypothetical protein n=1 Tax=Butyricimonas paravirosa TaxID=1472417 RepID=UPI002A80A331|nr:hypothetical protein [Butyricimonas paravirosa]